MYGVCYDDSSQNNIMTDIDKHSQKPYSTPFSDTWLVVVSNAHYISIFSNISIMVGPAPKKSTTARAIFCVKSFWSWEQYLQQ